LSKKQQLTWLSRNPRIVAAAARLGQVAEMKMLDKPEQSDRVPNPSNEKPESCYCSLRQCRGDGGQKTWAR